MDEKIEKYINAIVEAKWGKEKLYWIPTYIIWFGEFGRKLALALEPLVTRKEICFFDLDVQEDENYHFFNFQDMFQKTELMVFTKELPENYFDDLSELNPNVTLVVDEKLKDIAELFQSNWFWKNLVVI